jgi:ABC-type polysaccharide/polyol phosphate transport system ATPase subunit
MSAILAEGITKTFRMGVGRARVREMLPPPIDRGVAAVLPRWWARDTFNALDEVSLSVRSGSSVGIVGHNGAGKTTLLKVIAGITEPTRGSVVVTGRVAALIDVLVGFHPELTGRENIYLLGAIHGFGRRVMNPRIREIFEFAEIGDLADTPVKRYSAGMMARLGFATLTALDVNVLLVDEVLAVGDAAFQRKCVRWLEDYRREGGTLVFVSHNLGLVRNMTERAVWLDHGRLAGDGTTPELLGEYARAMERRDGGLGARHSSVRRLMVARGHYRWGAGGAHVDEVHVEQPSSDANRVEISISYESPELSAAVFCVGFEDEGGREIGAAASPPMEIEGGRGSVVCSISPLPFRSGIYFPVVAILSPDGRVRDRWRLERAVVVDRDGQGVLVDDFGPVDIQAAWGSST